MDAMKKTVVTGMTDFSDLAIAKWPSGGYIVFIHGAVLREKRHQNERVFVTEAGALKAGVRARNARQPWTWT